MLSHAQSSHVALGKRRCKIEFSHNKINYELIYLKGKCEAMKTRKNMEVRLIDS